jgi:transposase-like protein
MRAYSIDLRKKMVESVKKGVPKSETARRFGVDRATAKRYCKRSSMNTLIPMCSFLSCGLLSQEPGLAPCLPDGR